MTGTEEPPADARACIENKQGGGSAIFFCANKGQDFKDYNVKITLYVFLCNCQNGLMVHFMYRERALMIERFPLVSL